MELKCFAISDSGLKREHNEDSCIADPNIGFFAVADGMGGHAAGEVASRIAVDAAYDFFKNHIDSSSEGNAACTPGLPRDTTLLKQAILNANRSIISSVRSNGELRGMGTTIVAAKISGDTLTVGFVGDSRAYLIRKGRITQITTDHSWVNEQIKNGLMRKSDAEGHPLRNVITRALGINENVAVDVTNQKLEHDDILILCSDGLNTSLSDHEILDSVIAHKGHNKDIERIGHDLIEKANSNGGEDNTTIILIYIL
ncbi:MAG: Stp1/IreP family PP2C-type Ser/Thr phosphatase [Acidobacteriota bacterium]